LAKKSFKFDNQIRYFQKDTMSEVYIERN